MGLEPRSTRQPDEVLADKLLVLLSGPDRAALGVGALTEVSKDQVQLPRRQFIKVSYPGVQLRPQVPFLVLGHRRALHAQHISEFLELWRATGESGREAYD